MKIRPVSVAVLVTDRKRAAKWYRDTLGFKILEEGKEHWTVVGRGRSGMQLHLCETEDGKSPDAADTDTGILLVVDRSLPKAAKALAKRGVEFAEAPVERPWGWTSKIRDPDGNVLTLVPNE